MLKYWKALLGNNFIELNISDACYRFFLSAFCFKKWLINFIKLFELSLFINGGTKMPSLICLFIIILLQSVRIFYTKYFFRYQFFLKMSSINSREFFFFFSFCVNLKLPLFKECEFKMKS